MGNRVFVMWFGGHPLPAVRQAAIDTLRESGLDIVVLRDDDVADWEVADWPLLPAYRLLSPIQRSDYVRAYLMHHHGGGYTDIKPPGGSWLDALRLLESSDTLWAVGYPVPRWSVASFGISPWPRYQPWRLRWWRFRLMQLVHGRILGGGSYAFTPGTPLTRRWLTEVETRIRRLTPQLEEHPGAYAKERKGDINDGTVSAYPVPWSHVGPDVLQPLSLRYARHIARVLPVPDLENYQDDRPALSSGPRDLTRGPRPVP